MTGAHDPQPADHLEALGIEQWSDTAVRLSIDHAEAACTGRAPARYWRVSLQVPSPSDHIVGATLVLARMATSHVAGRPMWRARLLGLAIVGVADAGPRSDRLDVVVQKAMTTAPTVDD